jgi:hypothetical protein
MPTERSKTAPSGLGCFLFADDYFDGDPAVPELDRA